jgi:branched-chain amino acid transport system ATP-binding protein
VLRVDAVDVHYGRLQVLHGVSLEVGAGELVTLIGSNGAGKTTLLNTISGLLRPSAGGIELDGAPIDRLAPHEIVKRGICQVAQGRELFPDMTVLENLELGAIRASGELSLRERLDRMYEHFPILAARRKQRAGTLSGGEQQMLAIARALMAGPRLLLLDEPSAGLAPIVVDTLCEIVLELNRTGLSILLVEQNAYLALELAQRAYVLETGRVLSSGDAATVSASDMVRRAYLGVA